MMDSIQNQASSSSSRALWTCLFIVGTGCVMASSDPNPHFQELTSQLNNTNTKIRRRLYACSTCNGSGKSSGQRKFQGSDSSDSNDSFATRRRYVTQSPSIWARPGDKENGERYQRLQDAETDSNVHCATCNGTGHVNTPPRAMYKSVHDLIRLMDRENTHGGWVFNGRFPEDTRTQSDVDADLEKKNIKDWSCPDVASFVYGFQVLDRDIKPRVTWVEPLVATILLNATEGWGIVEVLDGEDVMGDLHPMSARPGLLQEKLDLDQQLEVGDNFWSELFVTLYNIYKQEDDESWTPKTFKELLCPACIGTGKVDDVEDSYGFFLSNNCETCAATGCREFASQRSDPSNSGNLVDLKRELEHLNDDYTFGLSPDEILTRKLYLLTQIERIKDA